MLISLQKTGEKQEKNLPTIFLAHLDDYILLYLIK